MKQIGDVFCSRWEPFRKEDKVIKFKHLKQKDMKKIMKIAFVAAMAAVAGYNIYQSQSVMNGMSEFALANVEALATPEVTMDERTPSDTYQSMELLGDGCVRYTYERLCAYGGNSSCTTGVYTEVDCIR